MGFSKKEEKKGQARYGHVQSSRLLRIIATLLKPFLSHTVERISEQMNFGKLNSMRLLHSGKQKQVRTFIKWRIYFRDLMSKGSRKTSSGE